MTYGMYRYSDDAGNNWAVSVPIDMATALGMTAATSEPFIDDTIAPRWANFRNASAQLRQGVIPTLLQFATIIGTSITIGGVVFVGRSARGESIGALQPNLIQPPQALMGPPGPAGPSAGITNYNFPLAADTGNVSGDNLLVHTGYLPEGGLFLIQTIVQVVNTSLTTNADVMTYVDWTGGTRQCAAQAKLPAYNGIDARASLITLVAQAVIDIVGGQDFQWRCNVDTGTANFEVATLAYGAGVSQLNITKIGPG